MSRQPSLDASRSERVAALAVACACAALVWVSFVWLGTRPDARGEFPLDDAWIHEVYARGLLRDGRPTYNDGVAEVGFSSPAWVLAETPIALLGRFAPGAVVHATKLLSLGFAVLAALGFARLVRRLGADRASAWITIAATLLGSGFAFSAVSGMEVTLAAACLAWGWVALAEERAWLAGLAFGLAAFTRPEAVVVTGLAAAVALLAGPGRRAGMQDAIRVVAPGALLLALWGLFDLIVADYPLPNTFYVKAHGGLRAGLEYLGRRIALGAGVPVLVVTTALVLAGVTFVLRAPKRERLIGLGVLGSAIVPCLAIALTHLVGRHVLFAAERYFYPFSVLLAPVLGLGVAALVARRPALGPVPTAAVAALSLLAAGVAPLLRARASYGAHCADIAVLHTAPSRLIAAHAPRDAPVIADGAGAARYFGERFIVDPVGLNDRRIAHTQGDGLLIMCRLTLARAAYASLSSEWLPALTDFYEIGVDQTFTIASWSVNGGVSGHDVVNAPIRARPAALAFCAKYARDHGE